VRPSQASACSTTAQMVKFRPEAASAIGTSAAAGQLNACSEGSARRISVREALQPSRFAIF
jgi:hypothetical protein